MAPGKAGFEVGKPRSLVLGQPQEEIPSRFKALRGQGGKPLQAPDRAHGGKVKRWRRGGANQVLQAFGAHGDLGEPADACSFFEESPLLGDRFEQRDTDCREGNFQGQAGEAGATADVKQFARRGAC